MITAVRTSLASFSFLKATHLNESGGFGDPLSGLLAEDHARLEEHLVFTRCHREEVRPE